MEKPTILLLGVGAVAKAVHNKARESARIIGTTRQPERMFELLNAGIEPIVMPWPHQEIIAPLADGADVLVSFPPDGETDTVLAGACANARSIVYISSTSVYGATSGRIDGNTEVAPDNDSARLRVEAENIWRSASATILRAPAIYGTGNGLHTRLQAGEFRIPGDGTNMVSRIFVDDLAELVLSVFKKRLASRTFVVGDMHPASHNEVVAWLCEKLSIDMPEYAPVDQLSPQLRSNRTVDASQTLKELGVTLKYPSYKEGFKEILGN